MHINRNLSVDISKQLMFMDMSISPRKLLILIFLFLVLIETFYNVEARGGGRGGGRGGSRGRSSGKSRSGGVSSRTRTAISSYKGPKYTSSMWNRGMAVGYLYGVTSYKRRKMYRDNPSKEPTVCFNAVRPKMGTYAYFICPESGQSDSYTYCCGEEGDQKCCGFFDDGGRVAGVVIGVIIGIILLIVIIYCVCKRCHFSKPKFKKNRNRNTRTEREVPPASTSTRNHYGEFPTRESTEMQPLSEKQRYGLKIDMPPEDMSAGNGKAYGWDLDAPPRVHGYQPAVHHPMPSSAPPPYSGAGTPI